MKLFLTYLGKNEKLSCPGYLHRASLCLHAEERQLSFRRTYFWAPRFSLLSHVKL